MTPNSTAPIPTPADIGFSLPAEWEKHEATWLAWPHNSADWPNKFDPIPWVYGEIVRKITPGEVVRLLIQSEADEESVRQKLSRAGAEVNRVEFIVVLTDRCWTRDSGPIFVKRAGQKPETAIVHFHFNAWAKYDNCQKDTKVPEIAARGLGKRLFNAECKGKDFVLEGGGIEVNGRGTL
ncbi:MAG: agmatine deiminase family protein, partial [Verrucomicrobiota bacterium]